MFPHLNPDFTGFILSNQRKREEDSKFESKNKSERREEQ